MVDRCVCCGRIIPEGRQVCPICEKETDEMKPIDRFKKLRKLVMKAISEIDLSCGCKSYEGTFEWTVCYPNYFEDETGDMGACHYVLTLHCYVLGSARHYDWHGKTMNEALDKAEKEIYSWIGGTEDGK